MALVAIALVGLAIRIGAAIWYDRNTLKIRGRWKTLVYKSAIKYMYKLGDTGRQSLNL